MRSNRKFWILSSIVVAKRHMSRAAGVAALLLVLAIPSRAMTEDRLDELYGRGVHSFNSGRYLDAITVLTQAIEGGMKDPRAYYYRGLAHLRSGHDEAADDDFRVGGEFEAADVDGYYPINRSLYRIQGANRVRLEKIREQAKSAARLEREMLNRTRYETNRIRESEVLREPIARPQAMPKSTALSTTDATRASPRAATKRGESPPTPNPITEEEPDDGVSFDADEAMVDEPTADGIGELAADADSDFPASGLDEFGQVTDGDVDASSRAAKAGGEKTGSGPLSALGKAFGETIFERYFGGATEMIDRARSNPASGFPGGDLPAPGSFPGDPNPPGDFFPPGFDPTSDDAMPGN